mgnify:CR=1 FL=1
MTNNWPLEEWLKDTRKRKKALTYGDLLVPAVEIKTRADAKKYLSMYGKYKRYWRPGLTVRQSRKQAMSDIGYWAGYYDAKTASRLFRLFDTAHPYFGRYA